MEVFVDSYDWTAVPMVYGMSQGAAYEKLGTDPAISTSNYILNMSHYEKGDWCDTWDGLYWRMVEKHRDIFEKDAEFKKIVKQLDRLNKNRRRVIGYRAEDFLKQRTVMKAESQPEGNQDSDS